MVEKAESKALHRALGEIVSLAALPAVWDGYRPPQIVDDVADVLVKLEVEWEVENVTPVQQFRLDRPSWGS